MRYRASINKITPAIPYLFAYDATGGQEFTSAGQFHTWDTLKIKTSHFEYSADQNRIALNTNSSGLLKIKFDCSYVTYDEDNNNYIATSIYKNGEALGGSISVTGVSAGGGQVAGILNCQTINYTVYLEKGDYIQIKSIASDNTIRSIANSSRISIEFLPAQGWDNSAGGREQYTGGVMR